ncbi:MAG: type I-E CRISPR-associated protein Cas7/Cse4/CasC [Tepidisphaeraceae bacterium]
MFVQIHMLQSMPPGNLNRDETGQPKKCIFGGVTRGRISSQCLKRNIRHSVQFKEAFGDALADRTCFLPRMVADELQGNKLGVPDDELEDLKAAIAAKFKKEKGKGDAEETQQDGEDQERAAGAPEAASDADKTGQLVFFPPPFARRIADLIAAFRKDHDRAYKTFLGKRVEYTTKGNDKKKEDKALDAEIDKFAQEVSKASKELTVDIGLFGRMTTSDLVVNVEAACQVAHAISTHETVIESDYFTAIDDRKASYATSQTDKAGAAYLGSGEHETFYSAAVYYKYLNLDIDALRKHLPSLSEQDAARVAEVLVSAAALANPTGKQNSFASHSVPELILVEVSKTKRPVSYANAFLQPVEGGTGDNLMTKSANALQGYVDSVAAAFAPADVRRFLLAVGHAKVSMQTKHTSAGTIDLLAKAVADAAIRPKAKATA